MLVRALGIPAYLIRRIAVGILETVVGSEEQSREKEEKSGFH